MCTMNPSSSNAYPPPTPYRISTITATGCVGTTINLDVLYNALKIQDVEGEEGIAYVEYGKKKSDTVYKGYSKKYAINRRKERPSKRFDNQVTIVYKEKDNQNLNIKTFKNGNVQITGIKSIDHGHEIVDKIISIIKDIYKSDASIVEDISILRNSDYKIRLINSDFRVGFNIKRENFYNVMVQEYANPCSYEPCIYPGVKIQYFYNTANKLRDGVCHCQEKCGNRKGGEGHGEHNCKKITIAVFQSGCIIITGSQTQEQVDECYKFITTITYKHADRIEKKMLVPLVEEPKTQKKIVLISKSKIINPYAIASGATCEN